MDKHLRKSSRRDNSSPDEIMAEELLAEYEDRILAGEQPAVCEYVARYTGGQPRSFEADLQLAAALIMAGRQQRVAAN